MNEIDYAVVIRTIGKANEKYKKLLNSIRNLEPQPKEVIVVLPQGYDYPKERLGYEKFTYSRKGMVSQRLHGLYETSCEYILFCDDDISFDNDYIEKLYKPIKEGKADATVGPLLEFFPEKGIRSFISMVLSGAMPTLLNKDKYTTILRSGGWSYNRINLKNCKKYYETQSAAWTNFFIRRDVMIELDFKSEIWLEKYGYAFLDDQTMFYKLYKMGYKTLVVTDAIYCHEDAKTSTQGLKLEYFYSHAFNHYVFWHRFIYNLDKNIFYKILDKICFNYWYSSNLLYKFIRNFDDKEIYKTFKKGIKDAKKYINSEEYKKLPSIMVKRKTQENNREGIEELV